VNLDLNHLEAVKTNMSMRLAERELQAQLNSGGQLVKRFQEQIVPSRSKNEAADCRGDRVVIKSMSLPPAKRNASALSSNYLFQYISFHLCPHDDDVRNQFLLSKLEPTRFHQWAGEHLGTLSRPLVR
jgi:hypothetical protein